MITPLGLNDVQLRFGRVLQKKSPTTAIQKSKGDEVHDKDVNLDEEKIPLTEDVPILSKDEQIKQDTTISLIEKPSVSLQDPPFFLKDSKLTKE